MMNNKKMEIDIKSIEFHIENNDYFGTLATILSIISQSKDEKAKLDILKRLEESLMFLQNNYIIIKK